jgi:hypothetical protein
MSGHATQPASASGEFAIGGDLPVVRLGYGSTQVPGRIDPEGIGRFRGTIVTLTPT